MKNQQRTQNTNSVAQSCKYSSLPNECYHLLATEENFVLLETSLCDESNYLSYLFLNPIEILQLNSLCEIKTFFDKIETYIQKGYYAAGYFNYEAGFAFEATFSKFVVEKPLAWIGIYKKPYIYNHQKHCWEGNSPNLQFITKTISKKLLRDIGIDITIQQYQKNIARIKEFIQKGDTYQINFTTKLHFSYETSISHLFVKLKEQQPVPYSAWVNTDKHNFLCFSPELFFHKKNTHVVVEPMKGTIFRGADTQEDMQLKKTLKNDIKNQAENIMIVDLLRNDLGVISEIGSVKVNKLFQIKAYKTLWQMTSQIESQLKEKTGYYNIFKTLFPCGSVTGAPKIRSMEIINQLEKEPRGIYTGAIGFFTPYHEAKFNIAIRTLVCQENRGWMGIGSGIVWDSSSENEYDEVLLKAKFLF